MKQKPKVTIEDCDKALTSIARDIAEGLNAPPPATSRLLNTLEALLASSPRKASEPIICSHKKEAIALLLRLLAQRPWTIADLDEYLREKQIRLAMDVTSAFTLALLNELVREGSASSSQVERNQRSVRLFTITPEGRILIETADSANPWIVEKWAFLLPNENSA